jgi:hypothetical protein
MHSVGGNLSEASVFCDDGRIAIFSYGSNSTSQLRARVQNPGLESIAAEAPGFARVFCLSSPGWGGGGVASLAPCSDTTTYGAVVLLTLQEKRLLDGFEGGYREETVTVLVKVDGAEARRSAMVYIAGRREAAGGAFTKPMTARPSEQYLTAIHCMLREHWDMKGQSITVRSCDPLPPPPPPAAAAAAGCTVSVRDEWVHPGPRGLSLRALCVEVSRFQCTLIGHCVWR